MRCWADIERRAGVGLHVQTRCGDDSVWVYQTQSPTADKASLTATVTLIWMHARY